MLSQLIQSKQYKDFSSKQVKEFLIFLSTQVEQFSITANINGVDFNPTIPESISDNFAEFTLFTLANYTFESLQLEDEYLNFEAGFGAENFGSICTIPYYAIFQITIDNSILFINPTATVEKHFIEEIDDEEAQKIRSLNAFKKIGSTKK